MDVIDLLQKNYNRIREMTLDKQRLVFPNNIKIDLRTKINWKFEDVFVQYTLGDIYYFLTNFDMRDTSKYYKNLQLIQKDINVQIVEFSH